MGPSDRTTRSAMKHDPQFCDDRALLEAYLREQSDTAFAQLVERHWGWVFAAAFRQLRDRHLAEDAAQVVFILLARRAHTMRNASKLSRWLFNTLKYTVANLRRSRLRRAWHETEAAAVTPRAPE